MKRPFDPSFAQQLTRARVAQTLARMIWKEDHFLLGDISLRGEWRLNDTSGGLYEVCEAAASDYLFDMDVTLEEIKCSKGAPSVDFSARVPDIATDLQDIVPHTLVPDSDSWIVYIPFDTCDYRLGGSEYARLNGLVAASAPEVDDAAYFADCFEVVREMVEDGIALSGETVSEGGLDAALKRLCAKSGALVDVSGIMRAYGGTDMERILHSEVPGVIIQINDYDFDYIDAELLLQDIAYYPLGHPCEGTLRITGGHNHGIRGIIDSLIR